MAITHAPAIRNGLANLVVDAIDAGTASPTGDIQLATADDFDRAIEHLASERPELFR